MHQSKSQHQFSLETFFKCQPFAVIKSISRRWIGNINVQRQDVLKIAFFYVPVQVADALTVIINCNDFSVLTRQQI